MKTLLLAILFTNAIAFADSGKVIKANSISINGKPKYGANFKQLDYVNANAPKGGTLKLSDLGGFDSLNNFSLKGNPAAGLSLTFDSLFTETSDDPSGEYCLICESIEYPADRTWIIFHLNPKATFNDGSPITAEDVAFSFEAITKGLPQYKAYYADVLPAVIIDAKTVRFNFKKSNNELPVIIGQLPILSKKYWEKRDLTKTTLEIPLGNGPYKIKAFEPGRTITYERVKDYWAKDLPIRKGQYNFDEIKFETYNDETVALEAFKGGAYDFRQESSSKNWAQGYEFAGKRDGLVTLEKVADNSPQGMQALAFNTRKPLFADKKVREAFNLLFDFDWMNKNLFFDAYVRTQSFFENSPMKSTGLPKGEELKVLEKYRAELPPEVFTKVFALPTNKNEQESRANLKKALDLFAEAGWKVEDGALKKAGKQMEFEFLMTASPAFERIVLAYQKSLSKAGIKMNVRTVDQAQYVNRMRSFDFEMTDYRQGQSDSPGNEQRDYWGSQAAQLKGSRNYTGISSPAIDKIIESLVEAKNLSALTAHVKALDRILLWNYLVVPNWHFPYARIAYWNKFGRPAKNPPRGVSYLAWWVDAEKEAKLKKGR